MVYRRIPKTCPKCGEDFVSGMAFATHRGYCYGTRCNAKKGTEQ